MRHVYLDSAATTRCGTEAAEALKHFASEDYGNPSSSHAFGICAQKAIRDSRSYFAELFRTQPDQVIFTASGTEADNLALYGVALDRLSRNEPKTRILYSATEHPAIKQSAVSLRSLGIIAEPIPVLRNGQINEPQYVQMLKEGADLVSIHQVNNIVGTTLPVEKLAQLCRVYAPQSIFHVDAVQAFGKIDHPVSKVYNERTLIDLVSISAHKIEGPKGVGALIVLNPALLKKGLRPISWGGGQESGLRSGTQSAGLIKAFYIATKTRFDRISEYQEKIRVLHNHFKTKMQFLLHNRIHWNSPESAIPHIISFSVRGYPQSLAVGGPLSKLLEERGFLVSTGSACSSGKPEPEPVLAAMALDSSLLNSMIRVSLSSELTTIDLDQFANATLESLNIIEKLLGAPKL